MTKKEKRYHSLYMDIAERIAQMSYCEKLKVGAILVKDGRIASHGWNGQPNGFPNKCEDINNNTLPSVLHAEFNTILKMARQTDSAKDSMLYITHSPCLDCAKLIYSSGIKEVYYKNCFRSMDGVDFLKNCGIAVKQLKL